MGTLVSGEPSGNRCMGPRTGEGGAWGVPGKYRDCVCKILQFDACVAFLNTNNGNAILMPSDSFSSTRSTTT